jgi:hypothetical protein
MVVTDVSAGRGRRVATDVQGYPDADRSAARAARTSMNGRSGQMRQTMTAQVRPDEDKATSSGASRRPIGRFGCRHSQMRSNFVATLIDETENRLRQPGNLGNVGLISSATQHLLQRRANKTKAGARVAAGSATPNGALGLTRTVRPSKFGKMRWGCNMPPTRCGRPPHPIAGRRGACRSKQTLIRQTREN